MNKWHMPIICHYLAARYSSRNQHQIASCQTRFQLFRGRHFGVSRIAHDLAGWVKWCWMNWEYILTGESVAVGNLPTGSFAFWTICKGGLEDFPSVQFCIKQEAWGNVRQSGSCRKHHIFKRGYVCEHGPRVGPVHPALVAHLGWPAPCPFARKPSPTNSLSIHVVA